MVDMLDMKQSKDAKELQNPLTQHNFDIRRGWNLRGMSAEETEADVKM
jgi:hypothetical protein